MQAVVDCGFPFAATEGGNPLFYPDLAEFAVGAGLDIRAGPGILSADIRHVRGLTDLNDLELAVEKNRITTRALQLLIGVEVIVQRR